MAKVKTAFFCTECGYESAKWMGKCPQCSSWNSLQEEVLQKSSAGDPRTPSSRIKNKPILLQDVEASRHQRIATSDTELDRVLGGGIVPGAVILLGGEPGVGKSTLLLQTALRYTGSLLYVSGEESAEQIKMRGDRLSKSPSRAQIYTDTDIDDILRVSKDLKPSILIIDSIQTLRSSQLSSAPGTVTQVRECTTLLQEYAKSTGTAVILIGHINKDGAIAGPKVLEHIVDVVLLFEGNQDHGYRLLRSHKNRFGATDEIGVYEMRSDGLRTIDNPSELLLSQHEEQYSGSSIAVNLEGRRPMLVEVQALVSAAVYSAPQRSATGYDQRRLGMLLAVLEKRAGFKYGLQDVYLNIAGGLKISDPAVDLAIVSSLISSLDDFTIPKDVCMAGEVGLSGEIRAVNHIEQRIQEADRLGFRRILVSKYSIKGLDFSALDIELVGVTRVDELFDILSF